MVRPTGVRTITMGTSNFHFRRKTDRNSPRTGQSSALSKNVVIGAATTRSFKKNSLGSQATEPGTFLYLGNKGDNALQQDIYSARSSSRKPKKNHRKVMVETPSVMRDVAGTPLARRAPPQGGKAVFDNNSYSMIKQTINRSPKMAKYIKEVYDANKYHSQMLLNRSKTAVRRRSPLK